MLVPMTLERHGFCLKTSSVRANICGGAVKAALYQHNMEGALKREADHETHDVDWLDNNTLRAGGEHRLDGPDGFAGV